MRTTCAAGLLIGAACFSSAAAQAQVQGERIKEKVNHDISATFEPLPGPAGEEWWRAGQDPFAGVLRPPTEDLNGPPPQDRATDCCPIGGWVQSLGYNPVWAGNVVSISQPILLKEIEIEANFSGPLEMTFGIYRETPGAPSGDYTSLEIVTVTRTGTGRKYYSSGPLRGGAGVPLIPKEVNGSPSSTFFAVAAGWGTASIDFRLDEKDYSSGIPFCAGRVRGSWGYTDTDPPAPGGPGSDEINGLNFFATGALSFRLCFEVPGGACCLGDRRCVDDVTSNACEEVMDGEFLGLFSLCALDDEACTGFGACCPQGQGSFCSVEHGNECTGLNTYKGDGTLCDDIVDPCSEILGACCRYDGTCEQVNEYDCEVSPLNGTPGVYQGDGVLCTLPGGGPRCHALGSCCDVEDPEDCTDVRPENCTQFTCVGTIGAQLCPQGYMLDVADEHCPQAGDQCYRVVRYYNPGEPCEHGACKGPVGACCLLGTCLISNDLDCQNMGGVFTPEGADGWQACDVVPVDFCESDSNGFDRGACCLPNGNCDILTAADCATAGGDFQQVGAACSDFICSEGACCYLDSQGAPQCVMALPFDCASTSGFAGSYQGTGTTCPADASDCFPSGACCFGNGDCFGLNGTQCQDAGGVYQGDGSICEEVICTPTAACCYTVFSQRVCDVLTEAECSMLPAYTWGNPGTTCTPNACDVGACCDIDTNCVEGGLRASCDATEYGEFHLGESCMAASCGFRGACCLPGTNGYSCAVLSEEDCNVGGGYYHGDTTVCDASTCGTAPCCLPGSSCIDELPVLCASTNGTPGRLGDKCSDADFCNTGACCLQVGPNKQCFNNVQWAECLSGGGAFKGVGQSCIASICDNAFGACCKVDLTCEELLASQCAAITDAVFSPDALCAQTTCEDLTGACCKPDATCEELTESACLAITNAVFLDSEDCGPPNNCPEFATACCKLDGSCEELLPSECALIGGATSVTGDSCTPNNCVDQCATSIDFDFDTNGHVDLKDFAAFQRCFGESSAACLCTFDADDDGDIDAHDFVQFEINLSGPQAAASQCAPFSGHALGDFDGAGEVDLRDFAAFQLCASTGPSLQCRCIFDENDNLMIDSNDLAQTVVAAMEQ